MNITLRYFYPRNISISFFMRKLHHLSAPRHRIDRLAGTSDARKIIKLTMLLFPSIVYIILHYTYAELKKLHYNFYWSEGKKILNIWLTELWGRDKQTFSHFSTLIVELSTIWFLVSKLIVYSCWWLAYGLMNNQNLFNFSWFHVLVFLYLALYFRYVNIKAMYSIYKCMNCKNTMFSYKLRLVYTAGLHLVGI